MNRMKIPAIGSQNEQSLLFDTLTQFIWRAVSYKHETIETIALHRWHFYIVLFDHFKSLEIWVTILTSDWFDFA